MGVYQVIEQEQRMECDKYLALTDASYKYWELYDNLTDLHADLHAFYKWKSGIGHYFDFGVFSDDWLSELSFFKKISELNKRGGYTDVRGRFSAEGYDKKYLDILDILEENGVATIFVPILNYTEISTDIEQCGFFVNAIFSSNDERDIVSKLDRDFILPVYCKYLLLVITRKPKESIYLELESKFTDYLPYLRGEVKVVNINNIYKDIIKGKGVAVKGSELKKVDLQSIYVDGELDKITVNYKKIRLHQLRDLVSVDKENENMFYKIGDFLSAFKNFKIGIDYDLSKALNIIKELIDIIEGYESIESNEFLANLKRFYGQGEKGCQKLFNNYKNKFIISERGFKYKNNTIIIRPFSEFERSELSEWDEPSLYVSVNDKKILPEYLEAFITSRIGCLSIQKALFINNRKDRWADIDIYLPSIQDQKAIVSSVNKMDKLNYQLDLLQNTLVTNPNKALEVKGNLSDWISRLDMLNLDERVVELIRQGETDIVEFKETLSLDVAKQTKEKYIELSSLKTIVGFLNSRGGALLVGVSDNGDIPGIFKEVDKFHKDKHNQANFDKFLLHFKNLIKRSVGEEYYPYIEYQLVDVNESKLLYVNCIKSKKPCYLNGKDFYVRTNPATDKLEGPQLVDYIQNHFS